MDSIKEKQDRLLYPDALRCLGMVLVIALHCVSGVVTSGELYGSRGWWLCSGINAFARMGVPLFFMISGYFVLSDERTRESKSFYKRRLKRVLLPFIVWDLLYFFANCLVYKQAPDLLTFFRDLVRHGSKYHLWYVYQIAAIYLLSPFLKRIVDHSSEKELFFLFFLILLQPTIFRLLNVVQTELVFAPFFALMEGYIGFYLLGYLLGRRDFSSRGRLLFALLGIAGLAGHLVGNYLLSSPEDMSLVFSEGYSITQYMTAAAAFVLVRALFARVRCPARLSRLLRGGAEISYGVYLAHVMVMMLYSALTARLGLKLSPALGSVVEAAVVAAATILVMWLISRIRPLRRFLM